MLLTGYQRSISANTLYNASIIEVVWKNIRTSGTLGTIQSAVYLSGTSGTLGSDPTVGSTLIATGASVTTANYIVKNVRDINKNGTSGTVANAATQYASDFSSQTAITTFTINNSNILYFQFCTSSTGSTDVSNIVGVRITEYYNNV
jgi:hypothetical protein